MLEAVKVALDPTPRQERLLEGHASAARFAYNLMLSHVQSQLARGEKADWSMYAQRRWWNEWKTEIAPWWGEYSKEAYNSANGAPRHGSRTRPDRSALSRAIRNG